MERQYENGNLAIVPEETVVAHFIFESFVSGMVMHRIAKSLNLRHIPTLMGGKWTSSTLLGILRNKRYVGDALMQKTYTVDFLRKKRVVNNGIMPQYYIEGHYEPIIPKELFLQVQEEMARRGSQRDCLGRKRGFSSSHCFSRWCTVPSAVSRTAAFTGTIVVKSPSFGDVPPDYMTRRSAMQEQSVKRFYRRLSWMQ